MAFDYRYGSKRWSLRKKNVTQSRIELFDSISKLSSVGTVKDAEYYLSTSKYERRKQEFLVWLYDPNTGKVMGRTGQDWFKLFLFFLVFYGCIAGFFAGTMKLFTFVFIMSDYPYLTGHSTPLDLNPGLGIIPQPDYWTSLIYFNLHKDTYRKYVDDLVAFTQWYEAYGQAATQKAVTGGRNEPFATCPRSAEDSMDTRKSCRQRLLMTGRCNMFQEFGYDEGMPCIILKLNRIYGWLPDPLDNHTGVLVRCYGRSDIDKDLLGDVCYHDDNDPQGKDLCKNNYGEFKSHYYPYLKQQNYQSPLVIVEFLKPSRNVIIMVECRAYAKNIRYNPKTGEGTVRFELLID